MKIVKIKKKSGGFRKLYCLEQNDCRIEYILLKDRADELFEDTKAYTEGWVHGFVIGRNCVSAAKKHVGYKSTTMLDIKDFFDSVTKSMVPEELWGAFIDGAPRQGLPSSPSIANLAFSSYDEKIVNKLIEHSNDFAYTRYADDIAVSYNSPLKVEEIIKDCIESAFLINPKKTRTRHSRNGRRIILGMGVDDKVYPTRKTKRRIRAAVKNQNLNQERGLKIWAKCQPPKK